MHMIPSRAATHPFCSVRARALSSLLPLIVLGGLTSPAAASPGSCPPSDHECSEVGGPGCLDVGCCETVCALDPFCCAAAWDLACVDVAAAFCKPNNPCPPGGPVNDCAVSATPMSPGDSLGFDSSTANTDGPPNFQCTYGKDVWYLIQAPVDGEFTITLDTPSFDSTLAVYYLGKNSDFDPADLFLLFTGCVDARGPGGETATFPTVAGVYYLLQVAGFNSGSGPASGPGLIAINPPLPTSCPACVEPPDDMVAWWPFDTINSNGKTPDLIDHNDACGSPLPVTGKVSGALDFSSSSLSAYSINSAAYSPIDEYTLDAWIHMAPASTGGDIITSGLITGGLGYAPWWYFDVSAADSSGLRHLGFFSREGGFSGPGLQDAVISPAVVTSGAWHHVAVTIGAPVFTSSWHRPVVFYVDGVAIGGTQQLDVQDFAVGGTVFIGTKTVGGSGVLGGLIDELEIFHRSLSPGEVAALAQADCGGKCKVAVGCLWDVPFCDGASSVTAPFTLKNREPVPQTYNVSFVGLAADLSNPLSIDGPTNFSLIGGSPVQVGANGMLPLQVVIGRPAQMNAVSQVGEYLIMVENVATMQRAVCHASVQDRRDFCATWNGCPPNCPPLEIIAGQTVGTELTIVNTSGTAVSELAIVIQAFGPDMTPSTTLSIGGLPPGESWTTEISLAAGANVTISTVLDLLDYVGDGFLSLVAFTALPPDGALQPLTSITIAPQPPPPCPGDLDHDGNVDGGDLGLMLGSWNVAGPADLNGNGFVDGGDLGLLLGAWGPCP